MMMITITITTTTITTITTTTNKIFTEEAPSPEGAFHEGPQKKINKAKTYKEA